MRLGAAGSATLGGVRLPSTGVLIGALIIAIAVVGLGFVVRARVAGSSATVAPTTAPVVRQNLTAAVSATGTVISTATSKLSFASSGLVSEVNVAIGDQVKAGQVLAREDPSGLEPAVLQAQANLSANQAKLALMLEGARPEDLAAARAQLDAAQAKLDQMMSGVAEPELRAAQSGYESAQAKLDRLRNPDLRDLATAQAAVESAQAKLEQLRAGPTQAEIIAAQVAVSAAHSARLKDSVAMSNIKDSPSQKPTDQQTLLATMAVDDANIRVAQAKLDQLTAGPTQADLIAAEATLLSAQQKLDQLLHPTDADVIAARAAVDQATNALAMKENPFTDADFIAQQQSIKSALANLATKRTPYQQSDILAAQAAVLQSQANLATAQANLAGATIVAPFDGVVSAVTMNVGETAPNPSTNNPISITVVDPRQMRVDVQVDESDIANVSVGQAVSLTFDALPSRTILGRVIAVAPSGTLTQGVVGYPVSIMIEGPAPAAAAAAGNAGARQGQAQQGAPGAARQGSAGATVPALIGGGVRAGMTATASIEYQRRDNVLTVPNRAIVRQGRDRFVDVMTVAGETERRKVEVGMANDDATEITSGVAEGETVVLPLTAVRASVPGAGGGALGGAVARPGGTFIAPGP